ncbi:hypothetical protein ACJMK2_005112 [Sinanodonta woodiana]|uniref:Protein-lysine N-trimethyltransferase SMYD5 n=1 Tax=Sinanodonta woodiana TaxID=1069815 RepID=A0ABD3VP31_SINWO
MAASSDNVEIRTIDTRKGKGLFAQISLKEGEVIFEEHPVVSTQFLWNEMYKYLACEYCLQSLETAEEMSRRLTENPALDLPYQECCEARPSEHVVCPDCQVAYCSEKCLQLALSSYHRVLCMGSSRNDPEHPLSRLQEAWRNIHYPPETASIMLLIKMVAIVKQAKNKEEAIQMFSQFVKATVNEEEQIAHKLLGAEFKDQLEILRQLSVEAFYEEAVQQWFTPEGFQSLFALIGTNGQGIGTSSIGVWSRNCDALELPEEEKAELDKFIDKLYDDLDRVSGTFLNSEGSGLYKLQSACNHSCVPNAEIRFPHNNCILALVALKDIAPEEEICISYLDECERGRSRHSRQKYLRDNYLFSCSCEKCLAQADDPDITSEEEMEEEEEDQ